MEQNDPEIKRRHKKLELIYCIYFITLSLLEIN